MDLRIYLAILLMGLVVLSKKSKVVKKSEDKESEDKKSEDRIIGGEVVTGVDRPHFMAIFNFKPAATVKCTASIVSSHWLISAAHCLVPKEHFKETPCLGRIKDTNFGAECRETNGEDIVVSFSQEASRETPEVFINVDDMMNMPREGDHMRKVTTIILPKGAYRGGKYGDYGGYDIILIKVAQPMDPSLAACLPGQGYRPISPMIGGYGRYRRVPCETTDMGPHVYEYCKVNPECQKGTAEYRDAKTDRCIKFNFNRVEHHQCIKDQPTPSSLDEDCKHFRMVTGITDKDMDRMDVNEFVLLSPRGDLMTSCYRMNAGKHGWCGTTANIVTGKPADAYKKDISVRSSHGWGICGDTCTDEEAGYLTGKARTKPVEIMDQEWCDDRLKALRRGLDNPGSQHGFHVFPLVYCIAYNETYRTKFYKQHGPSGNKYSEVPVRKDIMQQLGRDDLYYIRATGSCKGDSGGPLYEEREDKFVVIGTTSRGTGPIGNCGGRGNPTHYVRVQAHMDFLKRYINEKLCIENK